MGAVVGLAMACVFASVLERWRRMGAGPIGAEAVALSGALTLTSLGIAATLLAVFGQFDAVAMTLASLSIAGMVWPWGLERPEPRRRRWRRGATLTLVALVVGGAALRLPASDYPLAGRDQGTYTLRAQHTLRAGQLGFTDPLLAAAGAQAKTRSGPADLLGLYPKRGEGWRKGVYEAPYRPGWYLTKRNRGTVVPQFLHMHPMLMACAGLIAGPDSVGAVVILESAICILAIWCVARRFWPRGPWAAIATALYVVSPLCIWVHRTPLSEVAAGMLVWTAALAALRTRHHEPTDLDAAAFLLGSLAWLRGNGWILAPVILATLWLVPAAAPRRRRAALIFLVVVLAGVLIHASTIFPYLADELRRHASFLQTPTPLKIVAGAGVLAIAWLSIDELAFHRRQRSPRLIRLHARAPRILLLFAGAAVAWYVALRLTSEGAPYSRLDPVLPLLGLPLVIAATIGIVMLAWRWRPASSASHTWLLALAAAFVLTLAMYARRNLPSAGLYYYGRYLVPEILPAVCLAAVVPLQSVWAWLRGSPDLPRSPFRARLAVAIVGFGAGWIFWSSAGVLVSAPLTRMREFAGAGRIVEALAQRVPDNAVVIAGGEGWHHGHTYNQVAGALAIRHGRTVIPYRSREAAYATAYELLVRGPAASGRTPPPVFMLLGEATHHYTRRDQEPPRPIAGLDDLLPPPLRAQSVYFAELFTDRLTPVSDAIPTRVTRDALRMALVQLTADWDDATSRTWQLASGDRLQTSGLAITGGGRGPGCLSAKKPLVVRFSPGATAVRSLVLVAQPGTSRHNHRWKVTIDGVARGTTMPSAHRRARDTLGPFPVLAPPETVEIVGAGKKVKSAACPNGGVAEILLLEPDRSALDAPAVEAHTFAPPRDLGHPVTPTGWVAGRGLSRYRAGIEPEPKVRGVSLELRPDRPIEFAPTFVPAAKVQDLDIIVTITGASLEPHTRVVIAADGEDIEVIDPPDDRSSSWQSKPVRWSPPAPVVRFSLRLEGAAAEHERVLVRDIGLFSRAEPFASVIVGR